MIPAAPTFESNPPMSSFRIVTRSAMTSKPYRWPIPRGESATKTVPSAPLASIVSPALSTSTPPE